MKKKSTTIHGLKVTDITYAEPGNNLPKFLREAAAARGYGDATGTLSLFVQEGDVAEAFACAAQGNGAACIMAQAGKRLGAEAVYFYRTTAWVDFGEGPIVRFKTSRAIYNNVIAPFDEGNRDDVKPGIYHLTPPPASYSLKGVRAKEKARKKAGKKRPGQSVGTRPVAQLHTERVVMAARAAS